MRGNLFESRRRYASSLRLTTYRSKNKKKMNFKNTEIKLNEEKNLYIDFDVLTDIELIRLKRNGKTLSFPLWEFWQILEATIGKNL